MLVVGTSLLAVGGTTPQGTGCSRISIGVTVLNTALDGRPHPAPSRHLRPAMLYTQARLGHFVVGGGGTAEGGAGVIRLRVCRARRAVS